MAYKLIGGASYYNLPGNRMANGRMFDPDAMAAAMLHVPLGTIVSVTPMAGSHAPISVIVTDRGPYAAGRILDLTPKAFKALGNTLAAGVVQVEVAVP